VTITAVRDDLGRLLDRSLPPLVGRPDALQQILMNLRLNARDAIDGAGEVRIETRSDPARSGWIQLVVEDSGRGMSSDDLGKIFDPF
jgi:signal transduction histidine kinase